MAHGELIVGIEVPGALVARRSVYLKFRDRQSYEFALVSVAAAIDVHEGVVADVRLALGGVGTKPWRARRAEAALLGGPADAAAFRRAAAARARGRGRAGAQRVQGRARPAGDRARPRPEPEREAGVTAVGTPVTASTASRRSPARRATPGEISLPGMTYLAVVGATVPCGRVTAIDADAARAVEGVLAVLTHEDLPKIAAEPHLLPSLVGGPAPGESFFPMQDDVVHYAGQPVALVVAEEYEQAQYAASLVRVATRPPRR